MFGFQLDRNRYDSGFCIIVEFSRNNILFNCAENQILDFQGGLMRNELFFHEVLPAVQLSYPIFHLIFKTVDGRITIDSIRPCTRLYPVTSTSLSFLSHPLSVIEHCSIPSSIRLKLTGSSTLSSTMVRITVSSILFLRYGRPLIRASMKDCLWRWLILLAFSLRSS